MITHKGINNITDDAQGCVLIIGNFDGVHLGHRALIERGREIAKKNNAPLAVMTFDPHPKIFFKSDVNHFSLTSLEMKENLLSVEKIDHLFVVEFNKEFSQISSEDFINEILIKSLKVSHIIVGEDFSFGSKRSGNIKMLKKTSDNGAFGLTIVNPIKNADGLIYSSTVIRKLLRDGKFDEAEKLLGWRLEFKPEPL